MPSAPVLSCKQWWPECRNVEPLCSAPPSDLHVNSPPAIQPVPNKPKTMPLPWTQISQTIVLCVLECKCMNPVAAACTTTGKYVRRPCKNVEPRCAWVYDPSFAKQYEGLPACLAQNNAGSPRPKNVNGLRGTDRSYLLRFH